MRLTLKNPNSDYYSVPIISNSTLTQFWAKLQGLPGMTAKPETLQTGQHVHLAVYQPQLLTAEQRTREIDFISNSAKKCPVLQSFLNNPDTIYEEDVFFLYRIRIRGQWKEVPVKVKVDARLNRYGHDLKTTALWTRDEFISKFGPYGYWRQGAFYIDVLKLKEFFFTGVSKKTGAVFLVNTSDFPAQMKQARVELKELTALYLEQHPNYLHETVRLFNEL